MSLPLPGRKEIHAEVADMLGRHLANVYTLMLRLQNFHWNVEGATFYSAHNLFEQKYEELWGEVDEIAERIRIVGATPPATLKEFFELSQIADRPQPTDCDAMYNELITCYVICREFCQETLKTAGLVGDEVTCDLLISHLAKFEKAIWMFRSSLSRTEPLHASEQTREQPVKLSHIDTLHPEFN